MKFLFVSKNKCNALLEKSHSAKIDCVVWTLDEFENGDLSSFDALFFMPGYDSWERLLDFMARIQIRSKDKRLDGAWMRGYDLKNRDYYACNADADWGTYCIESGWCNTWVGKAWINYLQHTAGTATEKILSYKLGEKKNG